MGSYESSRVSLLLLIVGQYAFVLSILCHTSRHLNQGVASKGLRGLSCTDSCAHPVFSSDIICLTIAFSSIE